MTARTRYVVVGGCGIVVVGLLVGLVAYVAGGLPALAVAQERPDEFQYVPADASIIAFANVRDVMFSELRQRLRDAHPDMDGQREFQERTGIDIENDIDHLVAGLVSNPSGDAQGIVVLTGRFDAARLEALAREHGGTVTEYQGRRLITTTRDDAELAMAFVEPGVIAIGSGPIVRRAIDSPSTGDSVSSNDALMGLLQHIDGASNAWTVGRLDDPAVAGLLPEGVGAQIPQVAAFAVGGRVNGGLSGTVTAEARDEAAGQNLREVVQGFLALARMQTSARPELSGLLDGFQLAGAGTNVTLSFALSSEVVEQLLPDRSAANPADAP